MIGKDGRFLDARFTVDPRKEKQTMAFALIDLDTSRAAKIRASVGVIGDLGGEGIQIVAVVGITLDTVDDSLLHRIAS